MESPHLVAITGGALAVHNGAARRHAAVLRLGDLLVSEGLATPADIQKALRLQAQSKTYTLLGHILVDQKVITRAQLLSVLDRHRRRSKLGDLLVKSKAITSSQLEVALTEQRRGKQTLGEVVVRLRFVTEEQMRRALCQQLHINFFDLDSIVLDRDLRTLINPRFARKRLVVPIARVGQTLVVAMDDPTRTPVIDDLKASIGLDIEVITSTTASIRRALEHMYALTENPAPERPGLVAVDQQVPIIGHEPNILSFEEIDRLAEDKLTYVDVHHAAEGTASMVRRLLKLAVEWGASDIHLEAVEHGIQTRFRIDGVLQELGLDDLDELMNQNRGKLLSRLKILSKLDIAERRRPQDGSFRARLTRDGQTATVDFRISIIPGYYGESAVIRILDPRGLPQSVEGLGLRAPVALGLRQLLRSSTGILLVTGPTGSGKSTSLFGALKSVYQPGIKILTAENPIEYVCDSFRQHEVDERLGNTFAAFLRSFLRHDPDVIMIGEIRDGETANLAFRAAQTGHLVLSTLHANDAISALPRLLDLGVDANLIASSLLGVLSQRLAREVCSECREPYAPPRELLEETLGTARVGFEWFRGAGCSACNYTGYRGRMVLSELWTPNDADVVLINKGAPFEEVRESARRTTLSMADDVAEKLAHGRTNLEELIRALPHSALRQLRLGTR
ncbi:MAG TPA: ATPase, T2SS/T4P/T4SS family [Methylomirabilota bacterium]|nr:ATPase, T2SS/T4P/T4SS family [Methylomirabilota bacterium]